MDERFNLMLCTIMKSANIDFTTEKEKKEKERKWRKIEESILLFRCSESFPRFHVNL